MQRGRLVDAYPRPASRNSVFKDAQHEERDGVSSTNYEVDEAEDEEEVEEDGEDVN